MSAVFRGGRALFKMLPGNPPQQLPLPGMVQMPPVVPSIPTSRFPVGRRSTPFPENPEDIARRGQVLPDFDLTPADVRPTRIIQPYELRDPVTGQISAPEFFLRSPSKNQLAMLVQGAEAGDLDAALALAVNTVKRANTPSELYPALVALASLRRRFSGSQGKASPSRITRSGASDTEAYGGISRVDDLSVSSYSGEIGPDIASAIDTEVWRAAYRVGIPESEIGKFPDAFGSMGIERLGSAKVDKTELMAIRDQITKIRTRKSDSPDALRRNLEELDRLIAPDGPLARNTLNPRDTETAIAQYEYARSVIVGKLGGDNRGIKGLEPHLGKGLAEDKLHALFRDAVSSADNMAEIESISALAKLNFKSLVFFENIEGEALERVGSILAARAKAARDSVPDTFPAPGGAAARDRLPVKRRGFKNFEEFAETFRVTPQERILPGFVNENLFEKQLGSNYFARFGPGGKNFRSFEVLDPGTRKTVHVVERWNKDAKKWEETSRAAVNPNRTGPRVPEYEFGGDPKTITAFKIPKTEFQNFFHRISEVSTGSSEVISPIRRVRESLFKQQETYGLPNAQAKKVINEVTELIESMVSSGGILPGTPEYSWMHTVFGRLALNVSGPGMVKTPKTGMVARDRNSGRRLAALKALEKAEEAGTVPAAASAYIRKIAPSDEIFEKANLLVTRGVPAPKPQGRVVSSTVEQNERDAIAELIANARAQSQAATERINKLGTS